MLATKSNCPIITVLYQNGTVQSIILLTQRIMLFLLQLGTVFFFFLFSSPSSGLELRVFLNCNKWLIKYFRCGTPIH